MNNVISFTPAQLIAAFLAVCAGISCIAGASVWIGKMVKAAKAPNEKQNERITDLEKRVARHDELLSTDKKRLDHMEEGNRVTQRAILALLRHGINGNDIDSLKDAEAELHEFLIKQS